MRKAATQTPDRNFPHKTNIWNLARPFKRAYAAIFFLFIISSCTTSSQPDEKDAAAVVKEGLSLPGTVTAQKLTGGHSGSYLFLATDGTEKYVVRFMKKESQQKWQREIDNLKIAHENGYGPKIYFADPSKGICIMEYLDGKGKITYQDMQQDRFYVALAQLLQKIHRGKPFLDRKFYDPLQRIDYEIQKNKFKYNLYIPIARIEQTLKEIREALLPYRKTAPCHNDLHLRNIIFLENKCKAIDYEAAGPGDPFYDLAMVAAATSFYSRPSHEELLFESYLERKPSTKEKAILYLMKQVVFLKWTFDALDRITPEGIREYELIEVPPISEFAKDRLEGKLDLSVTENTLMELKLLLHEIFSHIESPQFAHAIELLNGD